MDPSKNLRAKYIIALSIIALLVTSSHLLISYVLKGQEADSRVINLAGRQRMLSQKITKASLSLYISKNTSDIENNLDELKTAAALWKKSHLGLQHGDAKLGLPGKNSPQVVALFKTIEPNYTLILSNVQFLIDTYSNATYIKKSKDIQKAIKSIHETEDPFLKEMDKIVFQYDSESKEKVQQLERIQNVMLGLTLLTLFLEAMFIFRPAQKSISRSQASLQAALDKAQLANVAKDKFLANMTHDLRAPLNSISSLLFILDKSSTDEEEHKLLQMTNRSIDNLLALVTDILDYARLESKGVHLSQEAFCVDHTITSIVETFLPSAAEKHLHITYQLNVDQPYCVIGDEFRFKQVVMNLLGNAIKYSDKGTIQLMLSSLNETEDGLVSLELRVKDEGIGIEASELDSIFDRFHQVSQQGAVKRVGSGIGLSIVKELVTLMNGTVHVNSVLGQGSEFIVVCTFKKGPLSK